MKLLFVALVISDFSFFVFSSLDEKNGEAIKVTENQLAIAPLGGIFKDYYVSLTEKKARLLWKSYKDGKAVLDQVDSEPFPDGFLLDSPDFRFSYLLSNRSLLVCRNDVVSVPQCLLLPVLPGDPNPIFGEPLLIASNYKQRQPSIWNTFQVVSTNGTGIMTAFLNSSGVHEPSWIIRETLDPSKSLINTGMAFDHRLRDLAPPYNTSENVYAFERDGFAYFLRYAYRFKYIGGDDYEWAWQLTRVCLGDRTKDLQSRASLPLNCSFSINSAEEPLGWRPSMAYFDKSQEQLYLYVQPNQSLGDRDRLKEIRHRICSFDMKHIGHEFDRMFARCYKEFSHLVATHSGVGTFATASCFDYKQRYEDSFMPECPIDVCSPQEDCNQMYHLEIYTPIYGTPVSVVDFRYQSPGDIDAMDEAPVNMYVISSRADNDQRTVQAFIRNGRGTLFMVFLNSTKAELNAPHAPAWTNTSESSSGSQLVELDDHSGIELIDGVSFAISTFKPSCSLYTECGQLINVASGQQARRLWGCGWCSTENKDFSTTERECLRANGVFHKNICPTKALCYEPRSWLPDENATLRIHGNFPQFFEYKITACGAECRDIKRSGKDPEESLTCTVNPPYLDGHSCGIEIVVIDPFNQSTSFTIRPECGRPIPFSVNGVPISGGQADKIAWWIFAVVSAVVVFSVVIYTSIRCHRRKQKKRRRRHDDSFSLPMAVTMEISHNNEYIQRRVHQGNPVRQSTRGNYESLVPLKLLIRLDSIELGDEIGRGHFGQVFKAGYKRMEGEEPVPVAVKMLIGDMETPSRRQFLQEGILMETFDHPNVLSLIGITFDDNQPMIVTPFMGVGNLLSYIRNPQNSPNLGQLLRFGLEIAAGMQYLHKLKFIHRDLAARNCMLDDQLHVKVADFGLSRDVYESESYMSSQQNLARPVRWMPPESIEYNTYTLKSDVWSYGVTLWELTTRGKHPYSAMANQQAVLIFLKSGRRLHRYNTPEEAYEIMLSCWQLRPEDRPDFMALSERLQSTMAILETIVVNSPSYYNVLPTTQQIVTSA